MVNKVSRTLHCPHVQSVLVDAAGIILILLYVTNTSLLSDIKGKCKATVRLMLHFFKQINSISWAKEKVTAHVAMYFM